jgi:uncharacterized membrane protein
VIAVLVCLVGCSFLALAIARVASLLPAAAVACAGAATIAVTLLTPLSQGDRIKRRRPYRIFMITQYGAHAILLL